jgi:hypothetical protein
MHKTQVGTSGYQYATQEPTLFYSIKQVPGGRYAAHYHLSSNPTQAVDLAFSTVDEVRLCIKETWQARGYLLVEEASSE